MSATPDGTTTSLPEPLTAAATADAIATGAVVRWWQTTALLRVAGPDALTLLDGLCTQAVERVEPGRAVLGLFLDAKAKVIAPAALHRVDDEVWVDPRTAESVGPVPSLLLETLPELVEPLRTHLAKYRLRAKVTIEPADVASVAVVGADAARVVEGVEVDGGSWTELGEQAAPTWTLLAGAEASAAAVRDALPVAGAALAAPDAFEAVRIEAGIAGLHDLLPGRMPAEVGGMRSAVALDAGCYLGQEPVARLHYRGHANRTLRRLRTDGPVVPTPPVVDEDGTPDLDGALALRRPGDAPDARPVGRLTTWAEHPDGGTVALAIARREVEAGDPLVLAGTDTELVLVDAPDEA